MTYFILGAFFGLIVTMIVYNIDNYPQLDDDNDDWAEDLNPRMRRR